MSLRPYKKWSPEEREAMFQLTLREIERLGMPRYPDKCSFCGQTEGIIEWHNENYSHPTKYLKAVCYRRHMAIHCKWRVPQRVKEYFDMVKIGYTYPPVFHRNFGIVRRDHGF